MQEVKIFSFHIFFHKKKRENTPYQGEGVKAKKEEQHGIKVDRGSNTEGKSHYHTVTYHGVSHKALLIQTNAQKP